MSYQGIFRYLCMNDLGVGKLGLVKQVISPKLNLIVSVQVARATFEPHA